MKLSALSIGTALCLASASALPAPIVFSRAGMDAASVQLTVDAFRAALGALNTNVAGSFGSGRREINWDGVPDSLAAPNDLPANFFNATSPRGVEFSTPGTGFQVSANAGIGAIEFGNIDANYSLFFKPFSAQRLFTALGSTITDVRFFVPGSSTAALTTGFGVVFSDVDQADTTSLEYFDDAGVSLGIYYADAIVGANETFSFLGVQFDEGSVVSRVRITSGNQILSPGNTASDLVVMDDFIYGEPVPRSRATVPVPATLPLVLLGLLLATGLRRRR